MNKHTLEETMTLSMEFGHIPKHKCDGYMLDVIYCSCGWESAPYFDGTEYAFSDWKKHVIPIIETKQTEFNFGL